jgi:DNA-directed RNA polymerase III subunit RPC6
MSAPAKVAMPVKRKRPAAAGGSDTVSVSAAEQEILRLCSKSGGGVPQGLIEKELAGKVDKATIVAALNGLLSKNRLIPMKLANQTLAFKAQSAEDAAKLSGLTAEDRLIYQEVERSANVGISTKELRGRTNMQSQQIAKTLKKLEARRLLQQVKSVGAKNKKVYMLVGLEPARELTGGSWYSGGEFDHELIKALKHVALQYIQKEEKATASQVHAFICEARLVRGKPPSHDDIGQVLRSLVYDAKIEQMSDALVLDSEATYKLTPPLPSVDALVQTFTSLPPLAECLCTSCRECRKDQPCAMMSEWLARSFGTSLPHPQQQQEQHPAAAGPMGD